MKIINKRPDLFLQNMHKEVLRTNQETLLLANQLEELVRKTKTEESIVLFSNNTFEIKASRYLPVVPTPHYFITGMQFSAAIFHNNSFSKESQLYVVLAVRLLFKVDFKSTRYNISIEKGEEMSSLFTVHPSKLIFEPKEGGKEKYGVIKIPSNGSWDCEVYIEDFNDFLRLKGIFGYACKKIGLVF